MKKLTVLLLITVFTSSVFAQDAEQIIRDVDRNLSADSRIVESSMTVHGRRSSRTMTSKSYTVGNEKSFTEYLSPAREKGTKMLKLDKEMWLYSPSTDRTIMISGHMLRQSVMGSDLSYEDMMEDRKLSDMYTASLTDEETIEGARVLCPATEIQSGRRGLRCSKAMGRYRAARPVETRALREERAAPQAGNPGRRATGQ